MAKVVKLITLLLLKNETQKPNSAGPPACELVVSIS